MHMKATITGKQLAKTLAIPLQEWKYLGAELRTRIITRTRNRHMDADNVPFEPYSEGYRKAKQKKAGVVTGVNLMGVGAGNRMLTDIAVVSVSATTNPRLVLSFATHDKATIARYHMGEGLVDRLFFAFSEDDLDYGVSYLRKRLQAKA